MVGLRLLRIRGHTTDKWPSRKERRMGGRGVEKMVGGGWVRKPQKKEKN